MLPLRLARTMSAESGVTQRLARGLRNAEKVPVLADNAEAVLPAAEAGLAASAAAEVAGLRGLRRKFLP